MAIDKTAVTIIETGTLAASSTYPATPGASGGGLATQIDTRIRSSQSLTLEGSFAVAGTITAHIRTSTVGGTDPADWDTQDYGSFDLEGSAGSREQITKGIWPDPIYMCIMIGNPGTEPVYNVALIEAGQDLEAN